MNHPSNAEALIGAFFVASALFFLWALTEYGRNNPGCTEDQAYVAYEDHNPNHGLSWHCVSLDELRSTTP